MHNFKNQNKIFQIARQMVMEGHDATGSSCTTDSVADSVIENLMIGVCHDHGLCCSTSLMLTVSGLVNAKWQILTR